MAKKRLDIYVTKQQHNKLAELSQDSGLGVSEHVRRAIDVYLQRYPALNLGPAPATELVVVSPSLTASTNK